VPAKELDEAEFTDRLRRALPGRDVAPIEPLTGGASSLTYSTVLDGRDKVAIKVCPPGLEPVRNRDMLRQARAQKALHGTAVPVPTVVAEDAGEPPDVPPFFVMEFMPGICVEVGFLPPDQAPPPEEVRGRQLDCARLMGELHKLDPGAIGLGDEPETSLAEEVERWAKSLSVCDEDLRAGTEDVAEKLLASAPAPMRSALLHGDFRTGNVLAEGDHVTSIIDWEIWSRADPRIDLAWFLLFSEDARRPVPPGNPTVSELIATYEAASNIDVVDLDWFRALVRYKQTATGAFIARNARRRGGPVEPVDQRENWLLISARELLGA
jgi:aminoglycoside phosphotransferase (APT) family kinase protein